MKIKLECVYVCDHFIDQFLFSSYSHDDLNIFKTLAEDYEHSRHKEISGSSSNSTQSLANFIQHVYNTSVVAI